MAKWQDKVSPSPKASGAIFSPGDELPAVIALVTGEDAEGNPQWAYAKISAQNYALFKAAEEQGNYSLADFGEILQYGHGKEPPEAIKHEMKEQYGCDEHFEESLAEMMEKAITEWDEALQDEDKR